MSVLPYRTAWKAAPVGLRLYAVFLALLFLIELVLYVRGPLQGSGRFQFELGYWGSLPVAFSAVQYRHRRAWQALLSLLGIQVLLTMVHILYLVPSEEVAGLVLWSIVPSVLWGLVLCLPQIRNFLDRDSI